MRFVIVLWFAVWVFIALVFMSFFSNASADYYRTMGVYHKYTPEICIMSPDPLEEPRGEIIVDMTYSAIDEWQNKMINATGGNWNMTATEYAWEEHDKRTVDDYPDCTIFITYPYVTEGNSVGRTSFDFSSSARYYYWVEIDTNDDQSITKFEINDFNNATVTHVMRTVELDIIDIRTIALHELGHGLGIEHYYLDSDCRYSECDKSPIMYGQIDLFTQTPKYVTQKDIDMLTRIYGPDGFGGFKEYVPRVIQLNE